METARAQRFPSLLRSVLLGSVALGLVAACEDEPEVAEAPPTVQEEPAPIQRAEPAAPAAEREEDEVALRPEPAAEPETAAEPPETTTVEPQVTVVETAPAEQERTGQQQTAAVSPPGEAPGQPLEPEAFAGNAREALGMQLRDPQGEAIGEVRDVVLSENRQPEALIVTLAGDGRLVRVPLDQIRVRPNAQELLAAGGAEEVRNLPTYDYSGADNTLVGPQGG